MRLSTLDTSIVVGYILLSLFAGLLLSRRATRSVAEYFVGGRSLSWWLAGISMIASAFAVDTPFGITGLVAKHGVQGVWFAWSFAIGGAGAFGAFVFAAMLRRSDIITAAELVELRYAGHPAAFLRGFKSLYFGVLTLSFQMGWVIRSVLLVCQEALNWDALPSLLLILALTLAYTTMSGFWGVAVTDFIQFFVGTFGSLALAYFGLRSVGGVNQLVSGLAKRYGAVEASRRLQFVPRPSDGFFPTFLVFVTAKWWGNPSASSTQRVLATRDDRHAPFALLLFGTIHFGLNYWPMIVAGLVSLAAYPGLATAQAEYGYARLLLDVLPPGVLGLAMASLTAAFMSTIDTQANAAASFMVNDIYRRFWAPERSEKHYVRASQVSTVIVILIGVAFSFGMDSVKTAWEYLATMTAGYGFVTVARWFWWRINAWSEIGALAGSAVGSLVANHVLDLSTFGQRFMFVALVSCCFWVTISLTTRPEPLDHLAAFCRRVKPYPAFWGPVRQYYHDIDWSPDLRRNIVLWLIAVAMIYLLCFGTGNLIFGDRLSGAVMASLGAVAIAVLSKFR